MKKKFKKKYGNGSFMNSFLPEEGATDAQALGKFGALQSAQNAANQGIASVGNSILETQYTPEEMAIINKGMNTELAQIPGIGVPLTVATGLMNIGKTKRDLKSFRANKQIAENKSVFDANFASGYAQDAKVTFAMGGDFSEFEGPVHEEGGITINPESEVEGGETKKGNYIFSDRLKVPGKKLTFAQMSKKIKSRYTDKRPNDPIDIKAEERELATLQDMQETVRGEIMSNAYTKAYGGFMKKKKYFGGGPLKSLIKKSFDEIIDSAESYNEPNYNIPMENLQSLGTNKVMEGFNEPKLNLNIDTKKPINTNIDESSSIFGMQPEDYVSAGVQSLAGASQLYYGLRGPDKVSDPKFNLVRPNTINMTPQKRLVAQEMDESFNKLDYDISQNATSAGNYLGNRVSSAVKRAREKAKALAEIAMKENLTNTEIMNNAANVNAQILNQEEQLRLQQEALRTAEVDAARQAVTEGLGNIRRSTGQTIKDKKAYNWQKLLAKNWIGTENIKQDKLGNKYYVTTEGNKYPNGKIVPEDLL